MQSLSQTYYNVMRKRIVDATAAILVAVVMFLLPNKPRQLTSNADGKISTLLDWPSVQRKMPWGTIILLGGGLSLAEGTKVQHLGLA